MADIFENVWDALEDDPAEAERMKVKSALLSFVQQRIRELGLNQTQAAERLGIHQPRVSDLLRGKLEVVSADALLGYAAQLGLHFEVNAYVEGHEVALA